MEQEATRFRAPSTSTTQTRQAPIACKPSTWQSVGMRMPAFFGRRQDGGASGTSTGMLLIESVIMG